MNFFEKYENHEKYKNYEKFEKYEKYERYEEQAGAELCQAQCSLSYPLAMA